jgi:hypothetical protein
VALPDPPQPIEILENSATCICDYPDNSATVTQRAAAEGHYNQAGGFCCPHHGNTCGYCHQYNKVV